MNSILTVTTAATATALTTLDAVKDELQITGSDEDTHIDKLISRVTTHICGYLHVSPASNGSRTVGQETLSELIRLDRHQDNLFLSRYLPRDWPITMTSVTENDEALDADEYELDGASGILRRLSNDEPTYWPSGKLVLVYTAGWLMPGDSNRNLPQPIEDAAIALIKLARFNRTRDQTLRSENILEGLYSYELFAPSDTPGGMPSDIAGLLEPYVNLSV